MGRFCTFLLASRIYKCMFSPRVQNGSSILMIIPHGDAAVMSARRQTLDRATGGR